MSESGATGVAGGLGSVSLEMHMGFSLSLAESQRNFEVMILMHVWSGNKTPIEGLKLSTISKV